MANSKDEAIVKLFQISKKLQFEIIKMNVLIETAQTIANALGFEIDPKTGVLHPVNFKNQ